MSRQDANEAFANTSFLYGGNASYLEDLYASYEDNPASLNEDWQGFFADLKDDPGSARREADGPSWTRTDWPVEPNGDIIAALDAGVEPIEQHFEHKIKARAQSNGVDLSETVVQLATRDSVRAIMMIRAYRMRGHFHANLDPLGLDNRVDQAELHPSSYGFTEADWDRRIFIDYVLGLEFATIREMLTILERLFP